MEMEGEAKNEFQNPGYAAEKGYGVIKYIGYVYFDLDSNA